MSQPSAPQSFMARLATGPYGMHLLCSLMWLMTAGMAFQFGDWAAGAAILLAVVLVIVDALLYHRGAMRAAWIAKVASLCIATAAAAALGISWFL